MSVTVHGIKNCDTIKKARRWLEEHHIDYRFHDFRKDGIDKKMLKRWLAQVDWNVLLNTRGTSWRKLPEQQRQGIDQSRAVALMLDNPAIIKRPVLTLDNKVHVGFKADEYMALFKGPESK